jgi:hypothetical protein
MLLPELGLALDVPELGLAELGLEVVCELSEFGLLELGLLVVVV